jgi:hypothetical protein
MDEGKLWSFFRDMIRQGANIEQDCQNGAYKSFEEFSARIDAAARERVEQFKQRFPSTVSPSQT